MKTVKYFLLGLTIVSFYACTEYPVNQLVRRSLVSEKMEDFKCINEMADKNLTITEVNSKIDGEWQLKSVITSLANTRVTIENIKTKINSTTQTIDIFTDDIKKYSVTYKLAEESFEGISYVTISSDQTEANANQIQFIGNIRICEKELLIDNGMARDAPAYLFRKN